MEFIKKIRSPFLFRIFHLNQKLLPAPKDFIPTMDSYTRYYYFKNKFKYATARFFNNIDNLFAKKNTFSPIIYSKRKGYKACKQITNTTISNKSQIIIPLLKS